MPTEDDAVSYEDSIRTSRTRWIGIYNVEQNAGYIFISMNQAQAYVIPKSAFASPGDADRFYQTAWQLWKGARPAGAGNPW